MHGVDIHDPLGRSRFGQGKFTSKSCLGNFSNTSWSLEVLRFREVWTCIGTLLCEELLLRVTALPQTYIYHHLTTRRVKALHTEKHRPYVVFASAGRAFTPRPPPSSSFLPDLSSSVTSHFLSAFPNSLLFRSVCQFCTI
jgi:hypothetical protein